MRFVKIGLATRWCGAEAGALSSMSGTIVMDAPLPSLGRILKSYLSEQSYLRPTCTGTGDSSTSTARRGSLGSGSYLGVRASVEVSATRERAWTSFRAGEGFIDW